MSSTQEQFSFNEKKEIIELTRDEVAMVQMVDSVYALKLGLQQNPDMSWDEFQSAQAATVHEDNVGYQLLKHSYEKYREHRQVALDWQKEIAEDPDKKRELLRQMLVPDELVPEISDFEVKGHNLVVKMNPEVMRKYSDSLFGAGTDASYEITYNILGISLGGLVINQEGKGCPVIIYSGTNEASHSEIIIHENEHSVFTLFYLRSTQAMNEETGTMYEELSKELVKELGNVPGDEFVKKWKSLSRDVLTTYYSSIYYNELVAQSSEDKPNLTAEDQTKLPEVGGNSLHYPYQAVLVDVLLAFSDYLNEKDIPDPKKKELIFDLYRRTGRMQKQAHHMTEWATVLCEKEKNSIYRTSILECVPPQRPWAIGFFIGERPEELRQQYESGYSDPSLTPEEKEAEDEADLQDTLWRYMLFEGDIDLTAVDAECAEVQKEIDEVVQEADLNDLSKIDATFFEKIYISPDHFMLSSIKTQLQDVWKQYADAGIPLPQKKDQFEDLINEKVNKLRVQNYGVVRLVKSLSERNSEVFKNAILRAWDEFITYKEGRLNRAPISAEEAFLHIQHVEEDQDSFAKSLHH